MDADSPDTLHVVTQYADLVRAIAHRHQRVLGLQSEPEDLFQMGMTGLLEAYARFDASAGVEFSTYAYPWIRGAILDGVRRDEGMTRAQVRAVRRARAMSEAAGSAEEASEGARGAAEFVWRVTAAVGDTADVCDLFSVESVGSGEADSSAFHRSPESVVEERQRALLLSRVLERLEPEERRLLSLIFLEGRSLREVAEGMGVSRSWVCRLQLRAVGRARRLLTELSPLDAER